MDFIKMCKFWFSSECCKSGTVPIFMDNCKIYGFPSKSSVSFKVPDLSITGFLLFTFRGLNDVMS